MIAPLVPFALRGVLWYQGEANAARHSEYASLFTGLIKQWREAFERLGGRADEWRIRPSLPPIVVSLDRATGLNHRELTGRSLWIPG